VKALFEQKDSVRDLSTVPVASPSPDQVNELIKQLKDLTAALTAAQGKVKGQNAP
jgi:hypothetical protein